MSLFEKTLQTFDAGVEVVAFRISETGQSYPAESITRHRLTAPAIPQHTARGVIVLLHDGRESGVLAEIRPAGNGKFAFTLLDDPQEDTGPRFVWHALVVLGVAAIVVVYVLLTGHFLEWLVSGDSPDATAPAPHRAPYDE